MKYAWNVSGKRPHLDTSHHVDIGPDEWFY